MYRHRGDSLSCATPRRLLLRIKARGLGPLVPSHSSPPPPSLSPFIGQGLEARVRSRSGGQARPGQARAGQARARLGPVVRPSTQRQPDANKLNCTTHGSLSSRVVQLSVSIPRARWDQFTVYTTRRQARAFERRVLEGSWRGKEFTVWGAGRDGRQFVGALR